MSEQQAATERQQAILEKMAEVYEARLEEQMGQLYNQFVAYIGASQLPLPQVVLVLEMILREAVEQAHRRYGGT